MAFKQFYHSCTIPVLLFVQNWEEKGRSCVYVINRLRLILANKNERDKYIQVRDSITSAFVLLLSYLRDKGVKGISF